MDMEIPHDLFRTTFLECLEFLPTYTDPFIPCIYNTQTYQSYCLIQVILSDFQHNNQLKFTIIQSSCKQRPTAFIANGVCNDGSLVT